MVRVDQSILSERNDCADLKEGLSATDRDLGRCSRKPAEMNEDMVIYDWVLWNLFSLSSMESPSFADGSQSTLGLNQVVT